MRYVVRYVGDGLRHSDTFEELHASCFPWAGAGHKYGPTRKGCKSGHWFLIEAYGYPSPGQVTPIGFAMLKPSFRWQKTGYLARAGVLTDHRGHGLQLRLIRARIKLARTLGYEWLISETIDNPQSANNLVSAGFRAWHPAANDRWNKRRDVTFWRCKVA